MMDLKSLGRDVGVDLHGRSAKAVPVRPKPLDEHEIYCKSLHGVAIALPMSGVLGVFGPSCIAGAQLAIDEVNGSDLRLDQQLSPIFLNSDMDCIQQLSTEIDLLLEREAIKAVVLMAYSEVRERLKTVINGRVPLVHTNTFDGNEFSPNVYTIGATPHEQFMPGVRRLAKMLGVRRWAMVGKNNVWPHPSSKIARQAIHSAGGSIAFEAHFRPGRLSTTVVIDGLIKHKPDIVFSSLAGQDAVVFHRAFGEAELHRRMFRFTELTDENILLASGPANTKRLYTVSSYFTSIQSDINLSLIERYQTMHGPTAPVMSLDGQSVYEGIHFYAALVNQRRTGQEGPIFHRSARGGVFHSNQKKENPIYLAEADQMHFELIGEVQDRPMAQSSTIMLGQSHDRERPRAGRALDPRAEERQ